MYKNFHFLIHLRSLLTIVLSWISVSYNQNVKTKQNKILMCKTFWETKNLAVFGGFFTAQDKTRINACKILYEVISLNSVLLWNIKK